MFPGENPFEKVGRIFYGLLYQPLARDLQISSNEGKPSDCVNNLNNFFTCEENISEVRMEKNKNPSSARRKLGNVAENSERDDIALDLKRNYIDLNFKDLILNRIILI